MKNSFEVTILNQKFVLKTENDEAHVKRIADYVNKVFADIQSKAHHISTQNVAILGALNLAEELLIKDECTKDKIKEWKGRIEGLVEKLG